MKIKNLLLAISFNVLINSVALAQWSASVNISPASVSAGQNESMGSCIGVSGDTVHIIWSDKLSSATAAIYYTRSTNAGVSWSSPVAITSLNGNAWNPAIAVNGSSIHVVWRNIVNNIRSSYYKRSLDGGATWGAAVLLDSAVADWPAVTVSGNNVYVANDIVTSASPYNTEIFFLSSADNGATWSHHRQITFSVGRSEDEAITAKGADVYMSWNDNRNTTMQIFYKHSGDFGATWGPDVLINSERSYGTMVSVNGTNVDIPSSGAPSGRYQIHLNQSANNGATWGADKDLTHDTASTYYYPYMVRDGADLHLTYVKAGVGSVGGQYIHSADGGATWSAPFSMGNVGITPFVAYTGCVVHLVWSNAGHIYYARNPTGNAGHCGGCLPPAQPGAIAGNASLCAGTSQTYSISAVAGATSYTWTLPAGWSGTSNTTSINVVAGSTGGNISVTANSSCGSSVARTLSVSVATVPAQPSSIVISGGIPRVCPGDVRTYTVIAVPGVTYNWTTPVGGTITSGQGTNSITIVYNNTFPLNGIIIVTPANSCGTGTARAIGTYRNIPPMPATISGVTSACHGSTTTYSIAAVPNAISYTWAVPAGAVIQSGQSTTSISVFWGTSGGNISVFAVGPCGNSAAKTLAVSITCREGLSGQMVNESEMAYPNPVSEELNITLPESQGKISLILVNALGQVVIEKKDNVDNAEKITLPVKSLPAGIYFLKVQTTDKEVTVKIMKQ